MRIWSSPAVALLLATVLLGGISFISLGHGSVIITTLTASLGSSSTNWFGAAIELTPASGPNNGIAFAVAPSCNENDPSGTTLSTGSFTTTPGDVIVMVVGTMHGPMFVSSSQVQDSLGNAYTLTTGGNNMEVWTATARSSGSDTITFTNSASGGYYAICAAEYSGAAIGANGGAGSGTSSTLQEGVQVAASTSWLIGGFVSWRTPSITMSSPDNQRQSDVNPNLNIIIGDIASAPNTHSPILINGDAGFTSANGVTGGTGTASDPYIIEGWNILVQPPNNQGIEINNTRVYFLIRNINIQECTNWCGPPGLTLMNVTNGQIEESNINCSNSYCFGKLTATFVSNITISNIAASTILVENSAHVMISHVDADLMVSSSGWIQANSIAGNLAITRSSNISVQDNIQNNPGAGFIWNILSSSNVTLSSSNIQCGDCVPLYIQDSDHVSISQSNISGDTGIAVQNVRFTSIVGNQVASRAGDFGFLAGINVYDSSNMIIANNTIHSGSGGEELFLNNTMSMQVYHNNIFGNNVHATDTYSTNNVWDNGYPSGGNFWSNYNGTDPDKDGIGDTPYVFNNNQDRYPLMSPFSNGTVTRSPVVFVAAPSAGENSLTGTTVSTGSFTATAGDVIVVVAGTMHGPIVFTSAMVTDTLGNTYSLATKSSNVGIWTTTASSSGGDIITFTNSGATTYYSISAAEYSSATVGTNTGTGSGTGNSLSVPVSGAASTSLVVGGFISWRTSSITMSSPDNQRQSDEYPNLNIIIGDIAASSSTTLTASLGSSSSDWHGIAVELKAG